MSKYEVMMVFSVKNGEDTANALLEKFKAMIEKNGTIDSVVLRTMITNID